MTQDPERHSWHDDTPAPRHWKGYVTIKLVLIVLAVILAVYLLGWLL